MNEAGILKANITVSHEHLIVGNKNDDRNYFSINRAALTQHERCSFSYYVRKSTDSNHKDLLLF